MPLTPTGLAPWTILELPDVMAPPADRLSYTNVSAGNVETIGGGPWTYRMLGSAFSSGTSFLDIDLSGIGIPDAWTMQVVFSIEHLPEKSDLNGSFIRFRTNNTAVASGAGVFISKVGMEWIGSATWKTLIEGSAPYLGEDTSDGTISTKHTLYISADYSTNNGYAAIKAPDGSTFHIAFPLVQNIGAGDGLYFTVSSQQSEARIVISELRMGPGAFLDWRSPVVSLADKASRLHPTRLRSEPLDARGSYDIWGANLGYVWEMLDGPEASASVGISHDAYTDISAFPFTNTINIGTPSPAGFAVAFGDYLLYNNGFYKITLILAGNYVTIADSIFPTGVSGIRLKIMDQSAMLGYPDQSVCPAAIDAVGQYLFKLTVDNGVHSDSREMAVVARMPSTTTGEIIDGSFIWNYLSDSWNLVADKEYINEYFSAAVQNAATLLHNAWNVEKSGELGTIDPYRIYRWVVLDARVPEEGDTTLVSSLIPISTMWAVLGDFSSLYFTVRLYDGSATYQDISFTFGAVANTIDLAILQINTFMVANGYPIIAAKYNQSGIDWIYIESSFQMEILGASFPPPFSKGQSNVPKGFLGSLLGTRRYKLENPTFNKLGLDGRFIVIRGEAYKIIAYESSSAPGDVVVVDSDLPVDLPVGTDVRKWAIPHYFKSATNYYDKLVFSGDVLSLLAYEEDGTAYEITDRVVGVKEYGIGTISPIPLNSFYSVCYVKETTRRFHIPVDPSVVSIPVLQTKVEPETADPLFYEGVDILLSTYRGIPCVDIGYFNPPTYNASAYDPNSCDATLTDVLFAEQLFADSKADIENNFGSIIGLDYDVDITPDVVQYLYAVRGLWFVFPRGRTIENLKKGINLFFALALAQHNGVIQSIAWYKNSDYGRMIIEDDDNPTFTRTYLLRKYVGLAINPRTGVDWVIGDSIYTMERISGGAEVLDAISDPGYYKLFQKLGYDDHDINALTTYHRFMVRANAATFTQERYAKFMEFLDKWRPLYTLPFFVLQLKELDEITILDSVKFDLVLSLQDTFTGYWVLMFDDCDAGGTFHPFDMPVPPAPPPEGPPYDWHFDMYGLVPRSIITAHMTYTFAGPMLMDTVLFGDGAGYMPPIPIASWWTPDDTFIGDWTSDIPLEV